MATERKNRKVNQRGSATVEAAIGFTVFLFAIFTILGMVNFCRAQMLISSAMDTAAKEMSQYSYFYEMSGLQKFEETIDENSKVGKKNVNQIIGTVDQLYSSINGAKDQAVQEKTNVENMLKAGELEMETFENAVGNLENSAEGVMQGITGVSNAMKQVGNDPLLYMRSLVAIIGEQGMEAAKRAIAVPLTKAFVAKHFGEDPDAKLEALGIEGGLDGLNFNMSSLFSDENHRDIELIVFYKVKLFQVFDWVILEANVSKVACCRAWLGGDDVIKKVSASENADIGEIETEGTTPEGEQSGEGTTEPTTDEEKPGEGTTEPTEPTEPSTEPTEPEKVDTEGSYWHEENWYDTANAFDEQLVNSKGIKREGLVVNGLLYGRDSYNTAYGMDYCKDASEVHSNLIYWDSIKQIAMMEDMYRESGGTKGYEPGTTTNYVYVIYVPENIPDEELSKIETAAEENRQEYSMIAYEDYGLNVSVSYEIVKAGGNYDYGSEGK